VKWTLSQTLCVLWVFDYWGPEGESPMCVCVCVWVSCVCVSVCVCEYLVASHQQSDRREKRVYMHQVKRSVRIDQKGRNPATTSRVHMGTKHLHHMTHLWSLKAGWKNERQMRREERRNAVSIWMDRLLRNNMRAAAPRRGSELHPPAGKRGEGAAPRRRIQRSSNITSKAAAAASTPRKNIFGCWADRPDQMFQMSILFSRSHQTAPLSRGPRAACRVFGRNASSSPWLSRPVLSSSAGERGLVTERFTAWKRPAARRRLENRLTRSSGQEQPQAVWLLATGDNEERRKTLPV